MFYKNTRVMSHDTSITDSVSSIMYRMFYDNSECLMKSHDTSITDIVSFSVGVIRNDIWYIFYFMRKSYCILSP